MRKLVKHRFTWLGYIHIPPNYLNIYHNIVRLLQIVCELKNVENEQGKISFFNVWCTRGPTSFEAIGMGFTNRQTPERTDKMHQ